MVIGVFINLFLLMLIIGTPARFLSFSDVYKSYATISYQYQMVPSFLASKVACDLYNFEILMFHYNLYKNKNDMFNIYFYLFNRDSEIFKTFGKCLLLSEDFEPYSEDTKFPVVFTFIDKEGNIIFRNSYMIENVRIVYGITTKDAYFPINFPYYGNIHTLYGVIAITR